MNIGELCPFCFGYNYKTKSELYGHLTWCSKKNPSSTAINVDFSGVAELFESNEPQESSDYDPNLHFDDSMVQHFLYEANEYITYQERYVDVSVAEILRAGHPALLNGTRKSADIRVYLEIARFISSCLSLSANECNSLLLMVKKITYINGNEIPIPARYSTIIDNLLRSTEQLGGSITKCLFPLAREIFNVPHVFNQIPKAVGVATNILHILGN